MLAVEDGIGELPYPVAQYHHAGTTAQVKVQLYVPVPVNKVVYVGVRLHILTRKTHQVLLVLAHIGCFFAIGTLQAAVLGPRKAQSHAPTGMHGIEKMLTDGAVEELPEHFELHIGVAKAVAVREEKHLIVYLCCEWSPVNNHSAL